MMRRRQRDQGDGITLFPFLAVLICTVGSLIVLLVVVVQQAKANAQRVAEREAEVQQEYEDQTSQVETEIEDLAWRIEVLQTSKQTTESQLQRQSEELSYLEDEIRKLRSQLERAALEAEDIAALASSDADTNESQLEEVERLKQALADAQERLEAARDADEKEEDSYALVAYVGPNGTRRRPIFIECRHDRVIFQPEGIELTSDDFEEPLTEDNPLAAALRAQREYLLDATGRRGEPPYPLIVVRPDGAAAYSATRAAMKAWDAEFGYELVDDSVRLKFPAADPAMVDVIDEAVEEARARRKMYQAIAPARFGRRQPELLTASQNGGFVPSRGRRRGHAGEAAGNANARGMGSQRGTEHGTFDHVNGATQNGVAGSASYAGATAAGRAGAFETGQAGDGQPGRYPQDSVGNDPYASTSGQSPNADSTSDAGGNSGASDAGAAGASSSGQVANGPSSTGQSSRAQSSQNAAQGRSGPAGSAGDSSYASAGSSGAATSSSGGPSGPSSMGAAVSGQPGSQGSMAGARGRDWALQERTQGATGITRPISLVCHQDRIVVLPENRYNGQSHEVAIDQRLRDNIDELVSLIWQRTDSWGIAGHRMFWKPVLEVQVQPDAEKRFVELASLLENSGVVVKRKR